MASTVESSTTSLKRLAASAAVAAMVACVAGAQPASAQTSGLVAGYSFDAGAGTTVSDTSGNNNTGTLSGATWTTAGRYGGALEFNGSTSRVSVPASPSLNVTTGVTLEAWVYPTVTQSGWRAIIQREVDAFFLHASNHTGGLRPAAGGTFGGSVVWASGPGAIPINTWTHLAQTYDGAVLRLYVNGTQVATFAATGPIETNASPLWIGGNSPYGEYFQGRIDDVRVYNRALNAAEVQTDMNTPVTPPPPNTTPTISTIGNQTILEDTATGALSFTVGDAETAAGSLTVSGTSSNTALVPAGNIVFGGTGAARTVRVTPLPHQSGATTVTITVSDGVATAPTSFLVTVSAVNDPPTISTVPDQITSVSVTVGPLALTVGDLETAPSALTLSATTSNPTLVPVGNIVFGGSGASRTVTVTPATNQTGTALITIAVSDGQVLTSTAFQLTVIETVNQPPTISAIGNQTTPVNTSTPAVNFTIGDVETPAASLTVSGASSNGTLLPVGNIVFGGSGASRTITLSPAAGQSGTATVTVTVSDGQLNTTTSFQMTVTAMVSGLVAAYGFEAGSGATVDDTSGNGNVGTVSGATWTTSGKNGGALDFNGSTARVSVPASPSLNVTAGVTLEAWVYPTATQGGWRAIIQREVDAFLLHASNDAGPLRPAAGGTFGGIVRWVSGPGAIPVDTWTHLAQTYDGATVRLYVNGSQVATVAATGLIQTNASPLWIGGNNPYGEYFQGRIDDVRVYNRALTAGELLADMNTPVGNPSPPPPVLQFVQPADGQLLTGTTVVDVVYTANGDLTGVAMAHFRLDGGAEVMDVDFDGSYQFINVPPGSHTLTGTLVRADHSPITGSDATVAFSTTTGTTNTPPVISSIADQTVPLNTATGALSFTVSDAETSAASLTVSGATSNGLLVPVGNIVFGGSGAARTVTVTPAANQSGTVTIAVTVSDGQLNTTTSFLVTINPAPGPPAAGLVAAYNFDAGVGATLLDVSGNDNTGTISGATWTTSGKNGSALFFNGSTNRVSVPASPSLNVTAAVTLEAWVYPTATQSGWRAIVQREVDAFLLHASNDTGALRPAAGGTYGGTVSWVSGPAAIPINTWTHLAQTYDGTTLRLYVNGAQVATLAATGQIETNASPLWIGGNNPYGEYFQGRIDDVRVYDRALTALEIQADLNTPVGGGQPPPLLQILQPTPNQSFTETSVVDVTYTATGDLTSVGHVHFQLDARPEVMDIDFDGVYRFTNVSAGSHLLKGYLVRADHSKIAGSDHSVNFSTSITDNALPTVAVTAPAPGATITGVATLQAAASDDTGIAGVQFRVNGVNVGSEDTTSPYSFPFNSTTVANGAYSVTAVARDLVGNLVTSTAVPITVSNVTATDPATVGQWAGPYAWPFVAIHVTLLPSGNVIAWDDHTEAQGMYMWHPSTGVITTYPPSSANLWCSGHTMLPDGRLLIAGGTGSTFNIGLRDAVVYNPLTDSFSPVASMTYGRYYPSLITLPDGNAIVFSGTNGCAGCLQNIPERYNRSANTWTALPAAQISLPYYPNPFVAPDGRIVVTSASEDPVPTRALNLSTQTWTTLDTNTQSSGSTLMYLPGKFLRSGTAGNPNTTVQATPTTQLLDVTQSTPAWRLVAPMAFPRSHHNLTSLPDGTVLAVGGGQTSNANDIDLAVHEAEIWSPATETWRTLSAMQSPRLYHGTALLLLDGRVLVAGSGRPNGLGDNQFNAEIFSPPYLFKGPRPVITSAPATVDYGAAFFVGTPDAARVAKVSLIRLGSVTHAFNIDQRYLELSHVPVSGGLNITAPPNRNTAIPGDYMLFLVDTNGVPSIAAVVHLPAP